MTKKEIDSIVTKFEDILCYMLQIDDFEAVMQEICRRHSVNPMTFDELEALKVTSKSDGTLESDKSIVDIARYPKTNFYAVLTLDGQIYTTTHLENPYDKKYFVNTGFNINDNKEL